MGSVGERIFESKCVLVLGMFCFFNLIKIRGKRFCFSRKLI